MSRKKGWYPDPTERHEKRLWDGAEWTSTVYDAGVVAEDPVLPRPEPDSNKSGTVAPDVASSSRIASLNGGTRPMEQRGSRSEERKSSGHGVERVTKREQQASKAQAQRRQAAARDRARKEERKREKEEEARRQAAIDGTATAERQKAWAERAEAKAEREFHKSPAGQARRAYEDGLTYFQTSLDLEEVGRDLPNILTHSMGTRIKASSEPVGAMLSAIEMEGWELIQSGFVYRQTHQDSRDKFLASGQQVAITGRTIGVYLFRRVSEEDYQEDHE